MWSREYWTDLMDQQRLQRLEQCRILTAILDSCEATHSNSNNNNKKKKKQRQPKNNNKSVPKLDEVGPGLRMLKYYNWRDQAPVNQKGCIAEQHAVWTCRAVALSCGGPLGRMKECFDKEGTKTMLSQKRTGYQEGDDDNDVNSDAAQSMSPCGEFQKTVKQCVTDNGRALAEKKIRWDKQRRDQQQ